MFNYFNSFKILLIKLIIWGIVPEVTMPLTAWSQDLNQVESENTPPNPAILQNQPRPIKLEKNRTFDYLEPIPEGYQPKSFDEESSEQFNTYRLDFGDAVSIFVQRFPEFDFTGVLDAEGSVVAPLLGRIYLRGLTLEEVETKISYELGQRFLQEEPQVIAVVSAERPVSLTLMGEVFKPGYYTLAQNTPMSTILAIAGGTTDQADLRSIIVKRTLVDGTVIQEKLDLYSPLIEGKKEPRLKLQAGDTVIVSQLQVGDDRDYDRSFIARTNVPQQNILVRLIAPTTISGVQMRNIVLPSGSSFLDVVAQLPIFVPLLIKEDINLMRFDPELGKVVTQTLNVARAVEDGDLTQDIPLRDKDVIVVSRTLLGRILAGFRVITQPIRDISGFFNTISNIDRTFNWDRR